MRGQAVSAILLAVAASLLAGENGEGGTELVYEFGDGEAAAAVEVLPKRLKLLGIEGATARAIEGGRRVVLRFDARDRLEDVQAVAERVGHLDLRRVVAPDTPGYAKRRQDLAAALARGRFREACEIPAESLSPAERERWPGGLRWYTNPEPTESPADDWLLCEVDPHGITETALEEVRAERSPYGGDQWEVHFGVKADFRAKMADLTSVENVRLATILDDEVLCAPVVRSQLTRSGAITMGGGERKARAIAAALGGGVLPSKPTFIAERGTGR